jgi:hypothetical protein
MKYKLKNPDEFNAYLKSVGSFADAVGVHPLNEDGTVDFERDMTVKYSEIDDLQFIEQMSEQDADSWKTLRKHFGVL